MYETIYIEKNKSSRFGVHFYQDSSQWNVFMDVCGIASDKTAVICSESLTNESWKSFITFYDCDNVLKISKNNDDELHNFLNKKKDYTFIILLDSLVLNCLYEKLTAEDGKISYISVPVTPFALFAGVSIRPKADGDGEIIRKEILPQAVYVDISLLSKATPLEFQDAIAAAFRLAVSYKASMFEWMISNMYELTDGEEEAVCELMERGFNVWKERIEKDTAKERALDIYGEDFYKLFQDSNDELSEAELTALSLVCQTYLSWKKELLSMEEYYEIRDMLVFFGLSITETFASAGDLFELCNKNVCIPKDTWVYIRKLGKLVIDTAPSADLIKEAFAQIYFDEEAMD